MGGAHSSDNRWTLVSQGAGMSTQRWSVQRGGQKTSSESEPLETIGPGPWTLELATNHQCPAVDVNRLK
ncbi:jg14381 [Pararge aegeria aegeria]|uniref:Jg14381 protein n=1 Tax=Pararge aegeria aegeria TaxID=348720 RepID=A0A8S4SA22_9NEOP|nr:jg14381 [Pararge aegeria aegeria]